MNNPLENETEPYEKQLAELLQISQKHLDICSELREKMINLTHRMGQFEAGAASTAAEINQMHRSLDDLRQRIAAMERVSPEIGEALSAVLASSRQLSGTLRARSKPL